MSECSNDLVKKAIEGDEQAFEKLLVGIKDKIYNLSLRMIWNPSDAEDVTQEILIKVITNLSRFRFESKFTTWVYRITCNHLININKRGLEKQELSFEIFEKGMEIDFDVKELTSVSQLDRNLLTEELKISCTHAMLLCLDREHRIIYILSSMFGVSSSEGAFIMNITPEAYRKRLSRTREKMRNFMINNCGLANTNSKCNCNKRIEVAVGSKRINPENLIFVNQPKTESELVGICKDEMEEFDKISAIFTSNPYYLLPQRIIENIKKILTSGNYKILEDL